MSFSPSGSRTPASAPDAHPGPGVPRHAALIVIAIAAVVRLVWSRIYGPIVEGDAGWYVQMAQWLATGRFHLDDGARPPFYPLFLLAGGIHPPTVQLLQGVLGTATVALVFGCVWTATRNTGWATLAGLIQALSPDALAFEAYLVTEAPATFLVTAVGVGLLSVRARPGAGRAAALGLLIGLCALNKTFHLYLLPFALIVLLVRRRAASRGGGRSRAALAVACALPPMLLVGGWCVYEWRAHGVFTPSTQTGYRLTQHVGNRIELAPDRYAVLRDIYLAHRQRIAAETGSHVNTIWAATADMERATGLSYAQVGRQVQAMSLTVVRADPMNYVRSVAHAWVLSWSRPMYVKARHAHPPRAGTWLVRAAALARPPLLLLNAAFLALAAALLWPAVRARLAPAGDLVVLAAMVITGATVAAIGELSDNGKFVAPFMPLVLVCVTVALARLRHLVRG